MKVHVGVDLGSTTSKAVILDDAGLVLGKGITNSRSNYDVAVALARSEAFVGARLELFHRALEESPALAGRGDAVTDLIARSFRLAQDRHQLGALEAFLLEDVARRPGAGNRAAVEGALREILDAMRVRLARRVDGGRPPSAFFRDLAASDYMEAAQEVAGSGAVGFDLLASLFDRAILEVENRGLDLSFDAHARSAVEIAIQRRDGSHAPGAGPDPVLDPALEPALRDAVARAVNEPLEVVASVGTGYGRARLPFPREQIRSEILCHGLGAHRMFPRTRTVLDIGGQDTKAIQLDECGIVTSFQMNDRCAAGCGRYLGYIADEMNLGVHELGPIAAGSCRPVRINSTCTVFAGAELRDRLTTGQKREDILAGLHRAIMLRAMSLLARSGGVAEEFTFTGGVARNTAAVTILTDLIRENYGERTLNVSPDSIYTGALGAALFAWRGALAPEARAA